MVLGVVRAGERGVERERGADRWINVEEEEINEEKSVQCTPYQVPSGEYWVW